MVMPLVYLFVLGGLQGLIGWIMVASGLNDEHLYVDHIKLAIHFIAAMLVACYTLWFALQLLIPAEKRSRNGKMLRFTVIILILLFVQLTYGAFMAGLKAAMAAATWPTINGMWIPDHMMQQSFVSHPINIHFVHRTLAYTLFFTLIVWCWWAVKLYRTGTAPLLKKAAGWTMMLVTLQVLLGIVTVISAPYIVHGVFGRFEILAELHQLVAMFLLMSLVVDVYLLSKSRYAAA
jgi:cytochrome c oxidase assembly protein subunit 15